MTLVSVMKSPESGAARVNSVAEMPPMTAAVRARDVWSPLRIRLRFPAPKFCAAKVVTEVPSASETSQTTESIRQASPHAAMALLPNELIELCKMMLETE